MIPSNITRQHVEQALREIEKGGVPAARAASDWVVTFEGKTFPPKYVLSIANKFANGQELRADEFSGGEAKGNANPFLRALGFQVEQLEATTNDGEITVDVVRAAFKTMFADAQVRLTCATFLADAIERAAAHGAARWIANMRGPTLIRLSVGRAYVLSLSREKAQLPVDQSSLDVSAVQALSSLSETEDEGFRSIPGSITYYVPADKLAAARELLLPAHVRFMERAAGTAKQTPYAYAHCPAIVDYLNAELGRSLPQPEYESVETPDSSSARSWIFQANPKHYDLKAALGQLKEINWVVRQHAKNIRAGDTAYLWLSGDEGGLLARAIIKTDPEELPARDAEAPFRRSSEFAQTELSVPLEICRVLSTPIERDHLLAYPELTDLGFLQAPQGTNFAVETKQAELLWGLTEGQRPKRFVKIAPGDNAKYWQDCLAGGYICVGWDEVGDLSRFSSFAEFRKAFASTWPAGTSPGHITIKAKELWTLRELRPGDRVVANRGIAEVVGAGEVVSGYAFRSERPEYKHTVGVKWDTRIAGPIPSQPVWAMRTVDALGASLAAQLFGASNKIPTISAYDAIRMSLEQGRLSFADETLSHYLLALQTKRFVLLTGISGTGKTQLALAVAKHFRPRLKVRLASKPPEGATAVKLAPYMVKYKRFVMPVALRSELEVDGPISDVELRADEKTWTCSIYRDDKRDVAGVGIRSELAAWLGANFEVGDEIHLFPSLEHGKARIDIRRPERTTTTLEVDNFEVIAVRPDWTDGRSLLGFYNPILRRYETTAFLRLLLRARDEIARAEREKRPPYPFFVVLDEMNLARVEHYFSDFLSALESGEPCVLHDQDDVEAGSDTEGDNDADYVGIPKRLSIPPNLFFTGTVNVDETTHMFSSKVLDRAFVLELHDVDLREHGSAASGGTNFRASGFASLGTPERPDTADWQELGSFHEAQLREMVINLHDILVTENRHFGFRVANEIARFIGLAAEQAGEDLPTLLGALDLAVLSKVLPKLHGTTQELRTVLQQLFAFAVNGRSGPADITAWRVVAGELELVDGSPTVPALPRSAAKLWRMSRRLAARGFTSFIE